jgi:hypothetical protein
LAGADQKTKIFYVRRTPSTLLRTFSTKGGFRHGKENLGKIKA